MTPDAVTTVARTLWGEARGDGRVGMSAVACVIANRAANPRWWGVDWVSVCQRPYQFSCWNIAAPGTADAQNHAAMMAADGSDPLFVTAMSIAQAAVGKKLADITHGADSYFAIGSQMPSWATPDKHVVDILHHSFYRVEL
jgi:N-acetylmuramoyl-L-alanine amidase